MLHHCVEHGARDILEIDVDAGWAGGDQGGAQIALPAHGRIKPILTHQAAKTLRSFYVMLRSNPSGLGQNSSYRITVRQLESLIRLSEALARVECSEEISVEHVTEAARLLDSSILKIHKSEVDLNEFVPEEDPSKPAVPPKSSAGMVVAAEQHEEEVKKKPSKMSAVEYDRYGQAIQLVLQAEEKREAAGAESRGIRQGDLIEQVITKFLREVNSVEEYYDMERKARMVIERLMKVDRMMIVSEDADSPNERKLKIHPNYVRHV